jgi:hypothetical protein
MTAFVCALAAAVAGACSSDPKAAGGGSTTSASAPPPPPPVSQSDAGNDGGANCYDGPRDSPLIEIALVAQDAPPSPVGGTIVPGTYYLTKSEVYTGADGGASGPSGSIISRHVVVGADGSWNYAECEGDRDGGIDECDKQTRTFAPSGSRITFTQVCPGPAGATHTVFYSVVGNELHLYPSLTEHEIHTKQP